MLVGLICKNLIADLFSFLHHLKSDRHKKAHLEKPNGLILRLNKVLVKVITDTELHVEC